ncbi:MAG: Gfo/Idh/MocA family oxidoreductase, partial [Anaerolineae bacterium]|nr:Gfo/Idh/MocA family oxidoreductase [Anaerolineae bacterium]
MAVRIGFIGTGGIAQMHMRNLQRIPDAQVVGMYDVAPDRARSAAALFPGCQV